MIGQITRSRTADAQASWAVFARTFACAAAGLAAGYLILAYAIDPYDSGRSRLFSVDAVRPQGPRTAAAVRGRDPAYRGAIFGNSHIQMIEPSPLSQATGIPFVQLSVIATGPAEQIALMDWYLRHHPVPRAMVVAADAFWCTDDPSLASDKPFPFWLFSDHIGTYLRGLLSWSVLEEIGDRIAWLLRRRREEAPRDGWWDFEAEHLARGGDRESDRAAKLIKPIPDGPDAGHAGPAFPAADRFAGLVARLPAETALVVVFPPIYAAALPRPGTARERAERACKAAIADAAKAHARSRILDWRRDGPESHDPALFLDQSHYRHPLARALTRDIAGAIEALASPE